MDTYSELLGFRTPDNAEIGYIGYSNKKLKIENESDLKEAFASGSMHKFDTPVFYICMRTDNEIATKRVRSSSDSSESDGNEEEQRKRRKKKPVSKEKALQEKIERLREKHQDAWGLGEYRLWATALDRGIHDSYSTPPDYPIFSKDRKKRGQQRAREDDSAADQR
ncbi:hypothetical protein OS493_027269 [Desmophyllum pertusum]|uniref:Uncharacterized protein n=1 Tax=Desmophyllum pertusum TaxID=174260 RepID=A0A9W9Z9X4_9CNID|nr:hypothetical protein OS493_027269 [Desmophyllum pertusum]